jgi:serine protease AprX
MPVSIPRALVEFILLGPEDDRRQLQDSPILGDVWIAFAKDPDAALELLITPYKEQAAGEVAATLAKKLKEDPPKFSRKEDKDKVVGLAHLQGIIAARLPFGFVARHVVPMTSWWAQRSKDKRTLDAIKGYRAKPAALAAEMKKVMATAKSWWNETTDDVMQVGTLVRLLTLAGLLLWARKANAAGKTSDDARIEWILKQDFATQAAKAVNDVLASWSAGAGGSQIWTISLNRKASPALSQSVPAVKADAARTVFTVKCKEIVWAVIDSGIDATHKAFDEAVPEDVADQEAPLQRPSRVKKSFDFTQIRRIISYDNFLNDDKRKKTVDWVLENTIGLPKEKTRAFVDGALKRLAEATEDARPIDWETVGRLIEIDPRVKTPPSHHGTHVAGILGASKKSCEPNGPEDQAADGMCPDIGIYDFRVLGTTLQETEFAIIAAMQYIRYINDRNSYRTIHGANLSLSIPHDVRNFACGRTPICNECERLVNSGVVVVAAAGNRGYQNFETKDGVFEAYAAFSVTDPGNADDVITVGATHRFWPHTYGVSFFSSRGPTGDGRMKPDIVAPGERIRAPLLGNEWGELDGTSMAAPHVSGAAAMLMARYTELIGQPRRIKKILCESATDLGRERSFQGRGMLDVLRAFQSI